MSSEGDVNDSFIYKIHPKNATTAHAFTSRAFHCCVWSQMSRRTQMDF